MDKYHNIEARSGLLQTEDNPVNLDDKFGQARLKDFAWRFIEEVGEALDAKATAEHYQEELIDGLHFLTELTILAGVEYDEVVKVKGVGDELEKIYTLGVGTAKDKTLGDKLISLIRELGMTMNTLKNKPWKQSQMRTDKQEFHDRLQNTWIAYMGMLYIAELSSDDIANVYLKKSQVNKFRIRTNY